MNADKQPPPEEQPTQKAIGCFFEAYNELGAGFLESVYEMHWQTFFVRRACWWSSSNLPKARGIPVGLLLNSGPRPEFKRRVLSIAPRHPRSSAFIRVREENVQ